MLGVDLRCDTVADGPDIAALEPDVVIVATGGRPRLPALAEGEDLVVSTWDIIGGAVDAVAAARSSCTTTTARKRRCRAPSAWSPPGPRSRSCHPIATSARR